MFTNITALFCALLVAAGGFSAFAKDKDKVPVAIEGSYGPEFTFTFDGLVSKEKKDEYVAHLRQHLKENQPEGIKFREANAGGNERFYSPNEWWFDVTTNPGVIEIRMSPLSVEQTRRFKSDIQDAIFASAAAVGLFPWDYLGGGHLNFDLNIFGNNLLLLRNFVVDFWNHSELSMGILSYDTNNAVPFAVFNDSERVAIARIIARADAGEWPDTEQGIKGFLGAINLIQHEATNKLGGSSKHKHHDLNFSHLGRVEIRSVRPQANMDVWLNQIELIESRINNHLRMIDKPLPMNQRVALVSPLKANAEAGSHRYIPPVNPQRALREFHRYVTESLLDWKDHRTYVWPPWVKEGELQKFEQSEEFKDLERKAAQKRLARAALACKGLLEL